MVELCLRHWRMKSWMAGALNQLSSATNPNFNRQMHTQFPHFQHTKFFTSLFIQLCGGENIKRAHLPYMSTFSLKLEF